MEEIAEALPGPTLQTEQFYATVSRDAREYREISEPIRKFPESKASERGLDQSPDAQGFFERIQMQLDDPRDRTVGFDLVAAREVPSQGDGSLGCDREHGAIAFTHLFGRQQAAERIRDVGIGCQRA